MLHESSAWRKILVAVVWSDSRARSLAVIVRVVSVLFLCCRKGFVEPIQQNRLHGVKMAGEKMICTGDKGQAFWFRRCVHNRAKLRGRRVLVPVATQEKFGKIAVAEIWISIVPSFRMG